MQVLLETWAFCFIFPDPCTLTVGELCHEFLLHSEKLTWSVHLARIVEKCEKVLNVMRSLAGCDWGAERERDLALNLSSNDKISIWLWMFYLWFSCKTGLGKLDVAQTKATRLRTFPVPALLIEMREMLLSLRCAKLGLQNRSKLSRFKYSVCGKRHGSLVRKTRIVHF